MQKNSHKIFILKFLKAEVNILWMWKYSFSENIKGIFFDELKQCICVKHNVFKRSHILARVVLSETINDIHIMYIPTKNQTKNTYILFRDGNNCHKQGCVNRCNSVISLHKNSILSWTVDTFQVERVCSWNVNFVSDDLLLVRNLI